MASKIMALCHLSEWSLVEWHLTLAYYNTAKITAIKSFEVQPPCTIALKIMVLRHLSEWSLVEWHLTIAYYNTAKITAVKSLEVQAHVQWL